MTENSFTDIENQIFGGSPNQETEGSPSIGRDYYINIHNDDVSQFHEWQAGSVTSLSGGVTKIIVAAVDDEMTQNQCSGIAELCKDDDSEGCRTDDPDLTSMSSLTTELFPKYNTYCNGFSLPEKSKQRGLVSHDENSEFPLEVVYESPKNSPRRKKKDEINILERANLPFSKGKTGSSTSTEDSSPYSPAVTIILPEKEFTDNASHGDWNGSECFPTPPSTPPLSPRSRTVMNDDKSYLTTSETSMSNFITFVRHRSSRTKGKIFFSVLIFFFVCIISIAVVALVVGNKSQNNLADTVEIGEVATSSTKIEQGDKQGNSSPDYDIIEHLQSEHEEYADPSNSTTDAKLVSEDDENIPRISGPHENTTSSIFPTSFTSTSSTTNHPIANSNVNSSKSITSAAATSITTHSTDANSITTAATFNYTNTHSTAINLIAAISTKTNSTITSTNETQSLYSNPSQGLNIAPKSFPIPTRWPSSMPTNDPSSIPSINPTVNPSTSPTIQPWLNPSTTPTDYPMSPPPGEMHFRPNADTWVIKNRPDKNYSDDPYLFVKHEAKSVAYIMFNITSIRQPIVGGTCLFFYFPFKFLVFHFNISTSQYLCCVYFST